MPTLVSPGAALSQRNGLELAILAQSLRALRMFLTAMERRAAKEATSPLAAGTPLYALTQREVDELWDEFVQTVMASAILAGTELTAAGWSEENLAVIVGDVTRAGYLTAMRDRLRASPLPSAAYMAAKKILTRGRAEGWSQRQTTAALTRALNKDAPVGDEDTTKTYDGMVRRIARTEATTIYNFSSLQQMARNGATGKRWVAHHDNRTRDSHRAADGQEQPLPEPFMVGGFTGMVPGDPNLPIHETASCRCICIGVYGATRGPFPAPDATPTQTARTLVQAARNREPQLTSTMKAIADETGGELAGLDFRVKGEGSLARKIRGDMAEKGMTASQAGEALFDVNRYTVTYPETSYAAMAQTAIDRLRASGHTVRVKNFWNVDGNPYQGVNMQVREPGGGRFELQFHTATSLDVKEGALHRIYEAARVETDPRLVAELTERMFEVTGAIPVPPGVRRIR